jgi:hypothetical protein
MTEEERKIREGIAWQIVNSIADPEGSELAKAIKHGGPFYFHFKARLKESGLYDELIAKCQDIVVANLEKSAKEKKTAILAEREACAKVAEECEVDTDYSERDQIAAAIRARKS